MLILAVQIRALMTSIKVELLEKYRFFDIAINDYHQSISEHHTPIGIAGLSARDRNTIFLYRHEVRTDSTDGRRPTSSIIVIVLGRAASGRSSGRS